MNSTGEIRPIRPWLLTILLLLVIVGLLTVIATPHFVRSGPGKISGIINILLYIERTKEEWATEHGYTNKTASSREITAKDFAPYFYREADKDFLVSMRLVIDKSGNLKNPQGVVIVINPLGISPEARFTKSFNLDEHSGLFSPNIPKGTIMRFSTNTEDAEYLLSGQESNPCKSLTELLAR
jgi:hypothetical protein